ncbi:hypothetical protein ABT224_02770 [Streptomyces sp. NPDC001584]|uniref:PASTA domain-containing protein n=1 Tax=Streptomyces sp. NPDC001584 TaxID=3154521 RepID=UPI00332DBE60
MAYGQPQPQPPYPYAPPPVPARPWWQTGGARFGFIGAAAVIMAVVESLGVLAMFASMAMVWITTKGLRHPWQVWLRIVATVGAFVLCAMVAAIAHPAKGEPGAKPAAAPSASKAPEEAAEKALPQLGDFTGKGLADARQGAEAAGYAVGVRDASDQSRNVLLTGNWTVCFQKVGDQAGGAAGKRNVDFSAVQTGEPCPKESGGALPWPVMPNVVGATYNKAVADLKQAGIPAAQVKLEDVYLDTDTPTAEQAAQDGEEWHVCFQAPDKDTKVTSTTPIRLGLGKWSDASLVKQCPAAKGTTYLIPANDPNYKRPGSPTADDDSSGSDDTTGGATGGSSSKTVHPGSFCSPAGAVGTANGKTYTCKGPDPNRWRP